MSIAQQHAYRFTYLNSEQWSNVRLETLASRGCQCEICGIESTANDAHHVWYPENIYDTKPMNLAILCRGCHDFTHSMLPECKTNEIELGLKQWEQFKNAINKWRSFRGDKYTDQYTEKVSKKHTFNREEVLAGFANKMSKRAKDIVIHISDRDYGDSKKIYRCRTRFSFAYAFGVLAEIPPKDRLFSNAPVAAFWDSNFSIRDRVELQDSGVVLIKAGPLAKALAKRDITPCEISAARYLSMLPAHWPCFIHIHIGALIIEPEKPEVIARNKKRAERLKKYKALLDMRKNNKKPMLFASSGTPSPDPVTPSPPTN